MRGESSLVVGGFRLLRNIRVQSVAATGNQLESLTSAKYVQLHLLLEQKSSAHKKLRHLRRERVQDFGLPLLYVALRLLRPSRYLLRLIFQDYGLIVRDKNLLIRNHVTN